MLLNKLIQMCISAYHSWSNSCQRGPSGMLSLLLIPGCVCLGTRASLAWPWDRRFANWFGLLSGCASLVLWRLILFYFSKWSQTNQGKGSQNMCMGGWLHRGINSEQAAHQLVQLMHNLNTWARTLGKSLCQSGFRSLCQETLQWFLAMDKIKPTLCEWGN